jgi:hypothetical protein
MAYRSNTNDFRVVAKSLTSRGDGAAYMHLIY